jgi:hypothetical protein
MAKKNNSNILLIAVAAGAFYFYGKVRSNLKDKQDAAKKAAEEAAAEAARLEKENKPATKTSAPVPSKAEKAYTDAVKKLQTALGVSPVTGFVGDKTKAYRCCNGRQCCGFDHKGRSRKKSQTNASRTQKPGRYGSIKFCKEKPRRQSCFPGAFYNQEPIVESDQ